MSEKEYVVVGGPIHRAGAYILDKSLENQKGIQENYPASELVIATVEKEFVEELKERLSHLGIKGKVILYKTVKPDYASSTVWNVSCGREAIRQYMLLETEAEYFLSIDFDMTFDPNVLNIMKGEIAGYDVVTSGYTGKHRGTVIGGLGCTLITREALAKVPFRCYEFKNNQALDEGEIFEMDSFSKRLKFKNGFFLTIDHYNRDGSFGHIEPHPVSLLRKISNARLFRYILMKTSILLKFSLASSLQALLSRLVQHH